MRLTSSPTEMIFFPTCILLCSDSCGITWSPLQKPCCLWAAELKCWGGIRGDFQGFLYFGCCLPISLHTSPQNVLAKTFWKGSKSKTNLCLRNLEINPTKAEFSAASINMEILEAVITGLNCGSSISFWVYSHMHASHWCKLLLKHKTKSGP